MNSLTDPRPAQPNARPGAPAGVRFNVNRARKLITRDALLSAQCTRLRVKPHHIAKVAKQLMAKQPSRYASIEDVLVSIRAVLPTMSRRQFFAWRDALELDRVERAMLRNGDLCSSFTGVKP